MMQEYDLHELRRRINTLEGQVDFLLHHFGLTYVPQTDVVDPRIIEFLKRGKMIEAIKVFRDLYPDTDLSDAKRAVEEIQSRHNY
ncbi:MAG TPA: hypothetical protein PKK59_09650 [Anaerolineaceae bacterium]|nr:hypothetical protein [Anaerolineaceae bacterium]